MIHVFAKRMSNLADSVERELFRIEKESRWWSSLINGVIAGTAVAIVAWLVTSLEEGDLLLFACLGSSAASVVFAPVSKSNSLRSIVLAYLVCAAVCVFLFLLRGRWDLPLAMQCFLAVSVSIVVMRMMEALHPAAVGSAMAFIIYNRTIESLLLLLLAIIGLLTVVKVLAYVYLEDLAFKYFPREFRRDYYGRELQLTMLNEPSRELIEAHERAAADDSFSDPFQHNQ